VWIEIRHDDDDVGKVWRGLAVGDQLFIVDVEEAK